jgi:hypothetical protein
MSSSCNARVSAHFRKRRPYWGALFLEHDADGVNDFHVWRLGRKPSPRVALTAEVMTAVQRRPHLACSVLRATASFQRVNFLFLQLETRLMPNVFVIKTARFNRF